MSDFDKNNFTKAETYVVYSSNFQMIFRSLFFKSSWFKHRLILFVYNSTIIVLCFECNSIQNSYLKNCSQIME